MTERADSASGQHWRNTHRFSDYKRFSVSTQESVNESAIKQ